MSSAPVPKPATSLVAKAFTAMTTEQKQAALPEESKAPLSALFNNPMVEAAKAAMSEEDLRHYQELGEKLHSIDFANIGVNSLPPPLQQGLKSIEVALRSGLLPTDLEKNEIQILNEAYGPEWWKRYDFDESDMEGVTNWTAGQ